MADAMKYTSSLTGAQIDAALMLARSIGANKGVPLGLGDGSIRIVGVDNALAPGSDNLPTSAAVQKAINPVVQGIDRIGGDMSAIQSDQRDQNNRVAALEARPVYDPNIGTRVDNLETAAGELQSGVDQINTDLDAIRATQIAHGNRLGAIESAVDATGAEIDRLKSGKMEDAELHLGFYLDENGDLCQKEE